ncbi:MAG: type II toxin-antitoxin system VapC family toxin [Gaiellaceae bacterium]
MGTVVVDSSVLIALLDPSDAHHVAARAIYDPSRSRHVISTTVLAEVLVGASRLGEAAVVEAEARIDTLIDDVCPVDRAVARAAAVIRAEHPRLRLPDALVLATAVVQRADALLTADRAIAAADKRVRVIG